MASPPGTDGDVQAAFAATLVDEWVRCGVAHAVVCPGSRSTPLAVALAARSDIVVHVRLDERSAGFTALGIGKAGGRPALVVTTSGTAAAELHPSVVEADLAGVPLIACTADRPAELRDVGAPQTIDQTHLFGRSVRWYADPGVPEGTTRSSWRSLAARTVEEAVAGPGGPGPVQLNLPFREPLLGDPSAGGGVAPGRPNGRPWHAVVSGAVPPPPGWPASLGDDGPFAPGRRGLIVAGADGGGVASVAALSAALGWPVLADPRSGLRSDDPWVIGTADGLLRSSRFARDHRPDAILYLGERWVSKVVDGFLSAAVDDGAQTVVVDPSGRWHDPGRRVATFVRADPSLVCDAVADAVTEAVAPTDRPPANRWLASWAAAEHLARGVIESTAGLGPDASSGDPPLDEPVLAARLYARLPARSTLVVSSSMPVRDLEAFGLPRPGPPRVLANRGANGIDGVVSTALGVALAADGPVVALVGDLAFLHDVSALVRPDGQDIALTVIVADNGGGGIFSFLPAASVLDGTTFDRLFGTPQAADPAAVAAGFGWPVDDLVRGVPAAEFDGALDRRMSTGGLSVICVRLPDRSANVAAHDRVNAAVVRAVDEGRTN